MISIPFSALLEQFEIIEFEYLKVYFIRFETIVDLNFAGKIVFTQLREFQFEIFKLKH